jgi:AcrR family transcriptional regulator
MTTSRTYHHGDLRNTLIAEGLALLEEGGVSKMSLRAIAARAGVSHAAPKNHFANLRALYTAMAAEGYRRHVAFMRAGLPKRASRTAKLAAAMQGYVRFAKEHPHLFALMFSSDLCDLDDAELQAAGAESYGVLREISAGLDWDKADKPHADLRAETMIWSLVHGFALLSNSGMFKTGPDGAALPALSVTDVVPAFQYRS